MNNNDILRKLRYIFQYSDDQMMETFGLMEHVVSRSQVCAWLKGDDHAGFMQISDRNLALFLNGLIVRFRGKRDGKLPVTESKLNHNIVFRKLKIALSLQAEDILSMLRKANFRLSKHELSAFFRKPDNRHYRECKDQVLRNFLQGLSLERLPNKK
ncbi:MAG: hypothetical protein CL916_03900 [Deltaproteobacteria bacterium]|nr:hypothetical protein [Deltaproteobacteria bacterium]